MHVPSNKANLNTINISNPDFHIWQHFGSNWTTADMHNFADLPEVPDAKFYKHMTGQSEPILLFEILAHPGTYTGTISMIFIVCIGVYCLKRFWCRPATPRWKPYSQITLQHATGDNDVETAPIYRSRGMVEKPVTPHENHDLCMEWEATMPHTGGSHLSHTAVKPDSHLAQIFFAKFPCIIKLIIING